MTKGRLFNAARIVVAVLVLVGVVIALWRNWNAVSDNLAKVSPAAFTGALVLSILPPFATLLGWRVMLADLGSRLPPSAAASVFFIGQLGKYLPGSVWSVVAQADMAKRLGVPRRRTTVVSLLSLVLAVLLAAILGVPALPLLLSREGGHVSWWLVALAVAAGALCFWPRLLNTGIRLGLRLLRREPLEHDLTPAAVALTTMWFTMAWLANGLSVLVLARSVGTTGTARTLLVASISGYCLAAAIGMASILVPAGVGVRDGMLVLFLLAVMPLGAATAVVVISRFLTVVADVVVAAFGWAWARRHRMTGPALP